MCLCVIRYDVIGLFAVAATVHYYLTLSDPGIFRELTIRWGGGGL